MSDSVRPHRQPTSAYWIDHIWKRRISNIGEDWLKLLLSKGLALKLKVCLAYSSHFLEQIKSSRTCWTCTTKINIIFIITIVISYRTSSNYKEIKSIYKKNKVWSFENMCSVKTEIYKNNKMSVFMKDTLCVCGREYTYR